jgi:hypothetical protein
MLRNYTFQPTVYFYIFHDSPRSHYSLQFVTAVYFVLSETRTATGKDFLLVFLLISVSIITPLLHTHFHQNNTLIRRTSGRNLETFVVTLFHYRKALNKMHVCIYFFISSGIARFLSVNQQSNSGLGRLIL